MNVFDNELVLEFEQGSVRYRDVPQDVDKCLILYTGPDPNGNLFTITGSVAFGPSGSWENISPGGSGSVWQLIGTATAQADGFLAPNEFWVDLTFPFPGPTGREVATIQDAINLANTLFGHDPTAIVIRLREGQDHVWPSSLVGPSRDITITAIGQVFGEGVDDTVSGRIVLGGAGVTLGVGRLHRNLTLHDVSIEGQLFVQRGWNVTFREVAFTGLILTADQGGGAATRDIGILLDRCTDDGEIVFGLTKALRIETTNHGPPGLSPTRVVLSDCELHLVVSGIDPWPFLSVGNSRVAIERCTFAARVDILGALFASPAFSTDMRFIDTKIVLNSTFGLAKLFTGLPKPPLVRFLGDCRINVINLFGSAVDNWSLGEVTASGPLLVEHAKAPSNPFPGIILSDENLYDPASSGFNGSITRRVFTRQGLAFTGGRKVYGSATFTGIGFPSSGILTWHTPTLLSAPTSTELPIANDRVVRVRGRFVARRSDGGGLEWAAASFEGVIQKTAGVASWVSGPTFTYDVGSAAAIALGLSVATNQLEGRPTLGAVGYTVKWVVELVFMPI